MLDRTKFREIKPNLTRPNDFESFWQQTLAELQTIEPQATVYPAEHQQHREIVMEYVTFPSLFGVHVHGYTLRWRDSQPRPLVVHSHGYMSKCFPMWEWAKAGLNVLGVDIRGFGRSEAAVPKLSKWGYILTGIDSPENFIVRGAVCDYMQAVRVAGTLYESNTTRLILEGHSFAGANALMSEAVMQVADLLVIGVPTFGWAEGRRLLVQKGSGSEINHFLDLNPDMEYDMMGMLRYFDSINFAAFIKCPTLLGVGVVDEVVPAPTVYAISNHMKCPLRIMEFPVSHSDAPEKALWRHFDAEWLALAQQDIPQNLNGFTSYAM